MSIENQLTELIALQKETLEAIKGLSLPAAAAPATRTRASKATAPAAEPTPAATPEPAKEEKPAASKLTANDVKKLVKDTRTRLADVSGEAVKAHKEGSAKILKAHGLADFTSIPDDKVESLYAAFKALNVEQPKDDLNDDLEDDDGL